MKWQTLLLVITFLMAVASTLMVVLITAFPNTFPSMNNHIQSEALLAVSTSPVIASLVNDPRNEIWTTVYITPTMTSLHANDGAALATTLSTTASKFTYKKWPQMDRTYVQAYFQMIVGLRDTPLANVTSLTLNLQLPVPALAENLFPLMGVCTISGVTISDQRIYTTLPNTNVCRNVTCHFEISPTVTLNDTPIQFNGYLLYTIE